MNNVRESDEPRVSVLMATYNGSRYIRQSVNSILAQTFRNFELIITNDCSTDETAALLASITDPRVRVLHNERNLGVVQSRNRCLAASRGRYIALLDHDDLSRPCRLARQVACLDQDQDIVLIGTAAHTLDQGVLSLTRHPAKTSPALICWLLHVANPLICSSIMFRAAALAKGEPLMRAEYEFADDYDLYHRLMKMGLVTRLDEPLTIYRLHGANTFKKHEDTMMANAVKVLGAAYRDWFGAAADEAASLVVRHLAAGRAVPDRATLLALAGVLERLNASFFKAYATGEDDRAAILSACDELWRRMLQVSAKTAAALRWAKTVRFPSGHDAGWGDMAWLFLEQVQIRKILGRHTSRLAARLTGPGTPPAWGRLFDSSLQAATTDDSRPPTLFVVVDTEAEFDWNKPFARELTAVTAMDDIERGQAVFDEYGLRPIYVVDFPISSQERSLARLRAMLGRDACYVGAHLHPWTTPPFVEPLSGRNSFPGNLTPEQEEQKFVHLLATIRERLGIDAVFYKAGRYGIGQATAKMLVRHGIKVDFSVLPGLDLTAKEGPNFGSVKAIPYWAEGGDLLIVPMTRGVTGALPWLAKATPRWRMPKWIPLQPILARLRLSDTITLTPEGISSAEQIRLIKSMLLCGTRLFVLHYHSPSLTPGHTPYVRSAADADLLVQRLRDVSKFFFEEVGGMPGFPPDLLEIAERKPGAW